MTISTPSYEATNEIDAALANQIDLAFTTASIEARQALNPATVAVNPIVAITSTVNFGIIAAGGAQRNFQVTTSITEADATDTGGAVQVD